jgi:manganese/zinc/iron transport system substrate-binding protein
MRILLAMICVSLISGCGKKDEMDNGKLNVVCTTGMITDVAKNIAGDRLNVIGLMRSGIDPHSYNASSGDVKKLRKAKLILFNGLHLEAKMGEIIEKMKGATTVAVAESIPKDRRREEGGAEDPHVWFDVSLWKEVAKSVKDSLISADPDGKKTYEKNYEAYAKKLDDLDAWVKKRVAELPEEQRVLITAHDAFGYFGKAYGFEVMGLQGISTVVEAGITDVQDLTKTIASRKIRAIFVETSVAKGTIEALQAAVKDQGHDVAIGGELFSDAMGRDGTEEGTYIGMVKHNVNTIVDALSGK